MGSITIRYVSEINYIVFGLTQYFHHAKFGKYKIIYTYKLAFVFPLQINECIQFTNNG